MGKKKPIEKLIRKGNDVSLFEIGKQGTSKIYRVNHDRSASLTPNSGVKWVRPANQMSMYHLVYVENDNLICAPSKEHNYIDVTDENPYHKMCSKCFETALDRHLIQFTYNPQADILFGDKPKPIEESSIIAQIKKDPIVEEMDSFQQKLKDLISHDSGYIVVSKDGTHSIVKAKLKGINLSIRLDKDEKLWTTTIMDTEAIVVPEDERCELLKYEIIELSDLMTKEEAIKKLQSLL